MASEIERAVGLIKAGGWDNDTQAALEFGLFALQIPQALSTCEGMDDDLAAIEAWAQIFTNPAELTETVSKHYLLHRKAINSDIGDVETDYDAGSWFQAGLDTADLLTLAVGPIN